MAIYAISDLHLSLNSNKPMDIFSSKWKNHHITIKENWNSNISDNDVVLIAGDVSWAMKFEEAIEDLDFIHNLNGKKYLIKGNHDYWWNSVSKLNALYDNMFFIQNTCYKSGEYAICGTRGWVNINNEEEHDEKIYKREVLRLQMSLENAVKSGAEKIIVMMHYPPVTKISRSQEILDILTKYEVEKVIYGHIHYDSKDICINGFYNNIQYICTSSDIINFNPIRIL